ncbi:hypothetical protein NPIL_147821 [Nephila pilipes]|uniref:Uncharacterized protein n=1 Tax=Nephila pilipes TaxID=299642 RepID=A0A8X6N876_NEPPI|nr:hypothetical protein NPIL_147821 [Nephila pilipes]
MQLYSDDEGNSQNDTFEATLRCLLVTLSEVYYFPQSTNCTVEESIIEPTVDSSIFDFEVFNPNYHLITTTNVNRNLHPNMSINLSFRLKWRIGKWQEDFLVLS